MSLLGRGRALDHAVLFDRRNKLSAYRQLVQDTLSPNLYLVPEVNNGTKMRDLISGATGIGTNTAFGGTITSPTTRAIVGETYTRFNGTTSFINLLTPTDFFPANMPTTFTALIRMRLDNWAGTNQYPLLFNSDTNNEARWFSLGTGAFRYRTKQNAVQVDMTTQTYSAGIHLIALTYNGSQMVARLDAETAVTAAMGGTPVNAMATALFGAGTAAPSLLMTGDVFEMAMSFSTAISADDFTTIYNKLIA